MGSLFALRLSSAQFLPLLDLDRPARVTRLFTTLADGQRKAIFDFYFREGSGGDWRQIGRVEWDSLPARPAGEPTLELSLTPERAGRLSLRLRERSSGESRSFSIRLPAVRLPAPEARSVQAPRAAAPTEAASARPVPVADFPVVPVAPAPAAATAELPAAVPAARKAFRWRPAVALALAAVLLAAAFAALFFTPLRGFLPAGWVWLPAVMKPPVPKPQPTVSKPQQAVPKPQPPQPVPQSQQPPPQPPSQPPSSPPKPAPAPEPRVPARKAPEELSHRVQWGDTLWRITERYYGNPFLYDLLAGENALADPNLLIPGTEIRLPPRIDDQDRKE